jgi:hypothetical protein
VRNEFGAIPSENIWRKGNGLIGGIALSVGAQIRHDDPKSARGNLRGVPKFDPVGLGIGEEAVQQDHGPALPDLMPGEPDPV